MIYHGSISERRELRSNSLNHTEQKKETFPIIITNYETISKDASNFRKDYKWQYIIIDEGHRLKNKDTCLVHEIKKLSTEHRLLLTGTLLQNELIELYNLFNYILPNIFDNPNLFSPFFYKCNWL